jgi:hypothetical protein
MAARSSSVIIVFFMLFDVVCYFAPAKVRNNSQIVKPDG